MSYNDIEVIENNIKKAVELYPKKPTYTEINKKSYKQ